MSNSPGSASSYKISLKSDNRSMSYGQKAIYKMAAAATLNFKKFNFWSRDCNGVQSISDVVYQISSKSNDFYRATRMHSVYMPWQDVRLSHAGIVPKRL